MTRGLLFAYNILTPTKKKKKKKKKKSGVREFNLVKLFYFYQMSEFHAL